MVCKCGKLMRIGYDSTTHKLDFYGYIEGREPLVTYHKIYECSCGNKEEVSSREYATDKQIHYLEDLIYDKSNVGHMRYWESMFASFLKHIICLSYKFEESWIPIFTKDECDKAIKLIKDMDFDDKYPIDILEYIISKLN